MPRSNRKTDPMPTNRKRRGSHAAARQQARKEAAERSATALRTYGLGERNPETLPDGSKGKETPQENKRNTQRWNKIRGAIMHKGTKYTGHGG